MAQQRQRALRVAITATFLFLSIAMAHTAPQGKVEDVQPIIAQAGTTTPEWWESVPLNYPETLDLTWSDAARGDPERSLAAYLNQRIVPDAARWREGARLLQHTLDVNANSPDAVRSSQVELGRLYALLKDWPRAAYWWQKAGVSGSRDNPAGLAQSLMNLGDRAGARRALQNVATDPTRDFSVLRLCLELGDTKKAAVMVDGMARARGGFMAFGEKLEGARLYPLALHAYTQALDHGGKPWDAVPRRARQAIAKLFAGPYGPDLARVPDGVHRASCRGFVGPVTISVTVQKGRIVAVVASQHRENRPGTAFRDVPQRIITRQGVAGVNAVTGATISSQAILAATGAALKDAERPQ